MDNNPTLAWMRNARGHYIYVNCRFEQMLEGVSVASGDEADANSLFAEAMREAAGMYAVMPASTQSLFCAAPPAAPQTADTLRSAKDAEPRWQIVEVPFQDANGELLVGGVAVDVSACAHTQERQNAYRFAERLADDSPSLLFVFDLDTQTTVYHNRDVSAFLGCTPEQTRAMGADFLPAIVHPDDLARVHAHLNEWAGMTDSQTGEFEARIRHADGAHHWVWARMRVFQRRADGTPVHILGIGQDVTERRQATEQLALRQHLAQQVAFSSPAILYIFDLREQRSVYNNREVGPALGYSANYLEELGASVFEVIMHPDDIGRVMASNLCYAAMQDGEVLETEYRMRHADGGWRWFYSRNTIFARDTNGVPTQIIGSAQDITDRKGFEAQIEEQIARVNAANVELQAQRKELAAMNAQLQALATIDGLTGLKNHRAFQEFLNAEFGRATRAQTPFSIVLLDVDKFKDYNDTFGHPAGDAVLKAVAQSLGGLARDTDMVARYGGEEFVIVMPNTGHADALAAAERLRQSIEALQGLNRIVTASFGVATWTPFSERAAQLVEQADQALYASKRQGRNRVSHFENTPTLNAKAA